MKKLGVNDFSESFGIDHRRIPPRTLDLILKHDFQLDEMSYEDRERQLLNIIDFIKNDKKSILSSERQWVWDQGWSENLDEFRSLPPLGKNIKALTPKFIKSNEIIRYKSKFWRTANPDFEIDYIHVLREFIFETYFSSVSTLCEFGAGSGHNLLHASCSLPNIHLIGTDYAASALQLMREVGISKGLSLEVNQFDIRTPHDSSLKLPGECGVLTMCAIEQVGDNFANFFDFLINAKVQICVNVEPTNEFFDLTILEDYLAAWFQGKRGYPTTIARNLYELESKNLIKIHKIKRLNFGSKFSEGYNLFVWSPIN